MRFPSRVPEGRVHSFGLSAFVMTRGCGVPRAMVVSIHDVAPATQERVEEILGELARHGVPACSLLVIPNYHRQGPSLGDPDFRGWLHKMQAMGHEIVLHGFFHERARRAGESVWAKFITRFYTADEGEFFDLRYATAVDLIRGAQHDFTAHGFRVSGFIAPAWLLGAEAERAAIDAGMTYTTTLRRVRDFVRRCDFASQSLVYSVRSAWRRAASLLWNRWLFARLTTNELLRLSIHPADITHAAIWRQILEIVGQAVCDRRPMTYQSWLQSVIPSEVEGSREVNFKVTPRDSFEDSRTSSSSAPATAGSAQDDSERISR